MKRILHYLCLAAAFAGILTGAGSCVDTTRQHRGDDYGPEQPDNPSRPGEGTEESRDITLKVGYGEYYGQWYNDKSDSYLVYLYEGATDSEGFFISDTQRAAYVNFVISMFSQSEYYTDIKDKAVFLDGMNYDGGVMISSANSHTMPLDLGSNDQTATFNGNAETSLSVAQYNVPRVTASGYRGEYINSISIKDNLNAGRIVSLLISEKSEFAEMFLFDAGISFRPAYYNDDSMFINSNEFVEIMKVSNILSSFRGWKELYVEIAEPLDASNKGKAESFHSVCSYAVFRDGNDYCIIISNSSNSQQRFLINDNAIRKSKSTVFRYSQNGTLQTERKLRSQSLRNILQPGEFFVVRSKQ